MAKTVETFESAYSKLMAQDLGDMKEPQDTIPSGEWLLRCTAAKETENDDYDPNDNNNDHLSTVRLTHTPVRPISNVDEAKIAEGLWRGVPIFTTRKIKNERDLFQVRDIVSGHGLSLEGRSLLEVIPILKGREVLVTIGLNTFKRRDGSTGRGNTLTNFRAA